MGRRRSRLDPDQPLPPGLYRHGRQFRAYRGRNNWVYFGEDYPEAMRLYAAWCGCQQSIGTVGELLDHFTSEICLAKVKAGKLKPRTARDYLRDSAVVKTGLGHIPYTTLKPHHVKKFADARSLAARSHARNEVAALSAAIQWAVEV